MHDRTPEAIARSIVEDVHPLDVYLENILRNRIAQAIRIERDINTYEASKRLRLETLIRGYMEAMRPLLNEWHELFKQDNKESNKEN